MAFHCTQQENRVLHAYDLTNCSVERFNQHAGTLGLKLMGHKLHMDG